MRFRYRRYSMHIKVKFPRPACSTFARALFDQPSESPVNNADARQNAKSDWCLAETRDGAVTAARGSTLLRATGIIKPVQ